MNILGINAFHGDASAALVKDGELVAAIEEERLNRRKHCAGFPALAVARGARQRPASRPAELDHVAISRDPKANLHKKILFAIQKRPSFTKLVKDRLANVAKVRGVDEALAAALGVEPRALRAKFHAVEHHKSHISSAFFVSPFEEAACLSIDGFGDFVSTMRGVGRDRKLEVLDRDRVPALGRPVLHGDHAVPRLPPLRRGVEDDGPGAVRQADATSSKLRQVIQPDRRRTLRAEPRLLPPPQRGRRDDLGRRRRPSWAWCSRRSWPSCSARRAIPRIRSSSASGPTSRTARRWSTRRSSSTSLEDLQRAHRARQAGAGGRLRAELGRQRQDLRADAVPRASSSSRPPATTARRSAPPSTSSTRCSGRPRRFVMRDAYTGPGLRRRGRSTRRIETARGNGWDAGIDVRRLDDADLYREVAEAVAAGKVVGWFQGRMEFGPRALGNRSIVADPRRADMKDILNTADQAPRDLPPVRAQRARGEGRRDLRTRASRRRSC